MATGFRRLYKMQLGFETSAAGTPVAATVVWRGPQVAARPLDVIEFVEEDVANFGGANRTVKTAVGGQVSIPDTLFTFEQFGYLGQMGIEGQQTGVADGEGSGKIYTFDFATTAVATAVKTMTAELGNNQEVADVEYCFCPDFSIKGDGESGVMLSGMLRGRQWTASQAFASLSVASVHDAIFGSSILYLDAAGGTMGTTPISAEMLAFTINVTTGWQPIFSGDGSLYFNTIEMTGWDITADVVFKHTANTDTEFDAWLAQTARLLEIKLQGANLATAGTTYSKYTCRFQLPGKWQNFSEMQDRNGLSVYTGTFNSKYDPTASLGPKIVLVNETASYWS